MREWIAHLSIMERHMAQRFNGYGDDKENKVCENTEVMYTRKNVWFDLIFNTI